MVRLHMIDDESFMDKTFEEKIKIMDGMTDKQIQENIEQLKFICKDFCGKCPSYQGTGETKLAFCTIGRSQIIKEKKGCLCPRCPVYKMMSFRWEFYCMSGNALELSLK